MKIHNTLHRSKKQLLGLFLAITSTFSVVFSESSDPTTSTNSNTPFSSIDSAAKKWWNGPGITANWFGLGSTFADYGLTISGTAREVFLGQLSGGLPGVNKDNWVNEEKVALDYDFAKIFGINGLSIESNWRYRNVDGDPNNPTQAWAAGTVGPSSIFNPSKDATGMGVRILTQFIQWKSDKSTDPTFLAKAGWVNPYEDFLQQPDSKWFQNSAIATSKGIGGQTGPGIPVWSPQQGKYVYYGGTAVPWSSTYAAWGGSLRAKPSSSTYVQSGLYLAIGGYAGVQNTVYLPTGVYPYAVSGGSTTAIPTSYVGTVKQGQQTIGTVNYAGTGNGKTTTRYNPYAFNNNGFNFQGAAPFQPNGYAGNYTQNGLYNVNEIGWTPKIGTDKLEGKYALGAYIWGQENDSYTPVSWVSGQKTPVAFAQNPLTWGLYLQADQRLYAAKTEVAVPADGKNPADGKSTGPATKLVADKVKGLYWFNEFTFTPEQNNALPFYFQTGFVYKGPIPGRDNDAVGIVLGAGFYSPFLNSYTQSQNEALANNYGSALNTTVPNGPTSASPKQLGVGSSTTQANYYAYYPNYSSTEVIEAFYNIQLNKWLSVRPDAQYIINPSGNGTVGNDWIIGGGIQANF